MKALRLALNRILNLLAGGSLTLMVLLVCWQVIARYILKNPSTWSEELTNYMFAASTMFGAAIVSGERGHMNIPIFIDRLGEKGRKFFHVLSETVAFLFSAAILVFGGIKITSLAMGQTTSSLGVQVGVFYTVLPICGVLILIYSVLNIVSILRGEPEGEDTNERAELAKKAEAAGKGRE